MTREVKVGLLIAFAAFVLVLAVFLIGDQEGVWKSRYHLKIKYDDVYGLLPGSPVRLAGLRVGTVRGIDFSDTEAGTIIVTLSVEESVRNLIRGDSKALIGTLGLLGDKTIEITAGTMAQPPLADNEFITAGRSSSIEAIISQGGEAVENIKEAARHTKEIIEKINNGIGSLGLFVNDPNVYFDLDRLLLQTEAIVKALDSNQGSFARFVKDSTFYVEMRNLLSNTNRLFDSLTTGQGTLAKLLTDPKPYEDIRRITSNFRNISDRMQAGEGTLGQLVTNDSLYFNLNRALDRTDALLKDFRENPGRYIRFRIF
jgi:phospholipid/cholesterol/gamma-HCH transport system substrate-binding protein